MEHRLTLMKKCEIKRRFSKKYDQKYVKNSSNIWKPLLSSSRSQSPRPLSRSQSPLWERKKEFQRQCIPNQGIGNEKLKSFFLRSFYFFRVFHVFRLQRRIRQLAEKTCG